jgi:heme/copper-type cytochrome/quinol oxidase subunit 2
MPGSILEPHGPRAAEIATLRWTLLIIAVVVLALVLATLAAALLAQRRPPALDASGLVAPGRLASLGGNALVVVFGLVVPAAILLATLLVDVRSLAALANPPTSPSLTITVDRPSVLVGVPIRRYRRRDGR